MWTEATIQPVGYAPPELVAGWRLQESPLAERLRHLVELMHEHRPSLSTTAEIEARVAAAGLREAPALWMLQLLDRLALDQLTDHEALTIEQAGTAEAFCELLYGLRRRLDLEVQRTPWGADWAIPELALRVFIAAPSHNGAPFYEICRL